MSTNFPTSLDVYSPVPVNQNTIVKHRDRHQNVEDAVEALETKVGVDSSADTNSLDYKVRQAGLFLQAGTGAITRTQQDKSRESVSASDYGAVVGGAVSQHDKFNLALQYLSGRGGGRLLLDKPGDYVVSASISPGNLGNDTVIEFSPGARVVALAGMNTPVFNLFGSASAGTDKRIEFVNPVIDCSAGSSAVVGTQQCTAIALTNFGPTRVTGGFLYGGENPGNLNADSGVSTVNCRETFISQVKIRGFNDNGLYLNGDGTYSGTPDGLTAIIDECVVERCNNAGNFKRDLAHVQIIGGTVHECTAGYTTVEITSPYNGPAFRMDVHGVRFKKITANAVRFRGPAKGSVRDCTFEDWGRTYDGSSSVGANAYAVALEGTSGISIEDNQFSRVDWALDDQRAYLLNDLTLDSVLYTQGKNYFSGNTYRNINRIVVQSAAGNPNFMIDEVYDTIGGTKFNSLNTSTVVQYREIGTSQGFTLLNGVNYPTGQRELSDVPAGATLVAGDSGRTYTNVGATALAVFNLPGASKGLEFGFYSMDTDGVQVTAAAGDIIRVAGSASSAGGTATNTQVGTFLKIRALDTTNWVAESAQGTWALA